MNEKADDVIILPPHTITATDVLWRQTYTSSAISNETSFREIEASSTTVEEGVRYTDGERYFVVRTKCVKDYWDWAGPKDPEWRLSRGLFGGGEENHYASQQLFEVDGSTEKAAFPACLSRRGVCPRVTQQKVDTKALFEAYYQQLKNG